MIRYIAKFYGPRSAEMRIPFEAENDQDAKEAASDLRPGHNWDFAGVYTFEEKVQPEFSGRWIA